MKFGRELRVGIFVVVCVVVGGAIAFAVGSESNLFAAKTEYHVVFEDASGLRPGSPVQVAGVPVGSVQLVTFTQDGRIEVRFEVVSEATRLIRGVPGGVHPAQVTPGDPHGSIVSTQSKGMLGDMLLSVSVGDPSFPEWPPDEPLPVDPSGGIMEMATEAMEEVKGTAQNLRRATEPLADEQFSTDLRATAHNLAAATQMLAEGEGALQQLMTDEATARELDATLANVKQASAELAALARSLRNIAREVETGNGGLHELVYGDTAAVAVRNIGRAGDEVALALQAIREGDGTAHDLIYGDAADQMIANLTRATDDVAAITSHVRAGRGTLGGLLIDPSIYEDVKRLVGDLERNDILR
ncbi:MAG: MCE family protein, partial [Polyangiaceae bacterium]|nr:MCE family protein [Polyangiaceae bacterium]